MLMVVFVLCTTAACLIADRYGLVLFVGDSAITAHYRLGIGVNNGFRNMQEIRELMIDLGVASALASSSRDDNGANADMKDLLRFRLQSYYQYEESARNRINKMQNLMVTTMMLEVHCDLIASYDYEYSELMIYGRREGNANDVGSSKYVELDDLAWYTACKDPSTVERKRTRQWVDADNAMVCRESQENVQV